MAQKIEVPQEVREIVESLTVLGMHLEVPEVLPGSEVRSARKSLFRSPNGMPDTFSPDLPPFVRKAVHGRTDARDRRMARARGRWVTSIVMAALDHVKRTNGSARPITVILPDDLVVIEVRPIESNIEIVVH